MKVVITGGTGMLGRRLALRLLAADELVGPSGRTEALERLFLVDAFAPAEPPPEDPRVEIVNANICDPAVGSRTIETKRSYDLARARHCRALGPVRK